MNDNTAPGRPSPVASPATPIEDSILSLTTARGPDKSICPSEVARALIGIFQQGMSQQGAPPQLGWQSLMTPVRQAAIRLARAGQIDILRKGRTVDPSDVRGVIRLRIKAGDR